MCVCVCDNVSSLSLSNTHTHTPSLPLSNSPLILLSLYQERKLEDNYSIVYSVDPWGTVISYNCAPTLLALFVFSLPFSQVHTHPLTHMNAHERT